MHWLQTQPLGRAADLQGLPVDTLNTKPRPTGDGGRTTAPTRTRQCFQNRREAMAAPSAIAASFAQTTSGSTADCPTHVP